MTCQRKAVKLPKGREEAHTPQAGRASIWERFWENVRPAKSTAVRMKSCMMFVYVIVDSEVGVDVDGLSDATTKSFTG